MQLTVATLGRPHGLRGELALDVRTDRPEDRLAVGTVLDTVPAAVGPLTVRSTRVLNGRWYATFAEIGDRTRAEEVRGVELVASQYAHRARFSDLGLSAGEDAHRRTEGLH